MRRIPILFFALLLVFSLSLSVFAVESGAYFEWELDEKIRLILDMKEDIGTVSDEEMALLQDASAAAMALLFSASAASISGMEKSSR